MSRLALLGLAAALVGCQGRLQAAGEGPSGASSSLAPAAAKPQFMGSDPLPRRSVEGLGRPTPTSSPAPPVLPHGTKPKPNEL